MTPIQETEIDMEKLEKRTMPSLTWRINEEKAEVRGETDELDAMRQAVSKILQTERYRYAVYDWNYWVLAHSPNAADPPALFIRQTMVPKITRKIRIPTL